MNFPDMGLMGPFSYNQSHEMNLLKKIKTRKMLVTLTIWVYVLWACLFIYKSSFIAIDGSRYFSLFDDAMISMRYAWNFSHGNGLV